MKLFDSRGANGGLLPLQDFTKGEKIEGRHAVIGIRIEDQDDWGTPVESKTPTRGDLSGFMFWSPNSQKDSTTAARAIGTFREVFVARQTRVKFNSGSGGGDTGGGTGGGGGSTVTRGYPVGTAPAQLVIGGTTYDLVGGPHDVYTGTSGYDYGYYDYAPSGGGSGGTGGTGGGGGSGGGSGGGGSGGGNGGITGAIGPDTRDPTDHPPKPAPKPTKPGPLPGINGFNPGLIFQPVTYTKSATVSRDVAGLLEQVAAYDESGPDTVVQPVKSASWFADGAMQPKFVDTWTTNPTWPSFPTGYYLAVMQTMDGDKQIPVAVSVDPRLVAVNWGADPGDGTPVCDTDGSGAFAQDRTAPLQCAFRVVRGLVGDLSLAFQHGGNPLTDLAGEEPATGGGDTGDSSDGGGSGDSGGGTGSPPPPAPPKPAPHNKGGTSGGYDGMGGHHGNDGSPPPDFRKSVLSGSFELKSQGDTGNFQRMNTLALNIGVSGNNDSPGLLVADGLRKGQGTTWLARLSCRDGGFIDVGDDRCTHKIGDDADGNPVHAAHLSTVSFFRGPVFQTSYGTLKEIAATFQGAGATSGLLGSSTKVIGNPVPIVYQTFGVQVGAQSGVSDSPLFFESLDYPMNASVGTYPIHVHCGFDGGQSFNWPAYSQKKQGFGVKKWWTKTLVGLAKTGPVTTPGGGDPPRVPGIPGVPPIPPVNPPVNRGGGSQEFSSGLVQRYSSKNTSPRVYGVHVLELAGPGELWRPQRYVEGETDARSMLGAKDSAAVDRIESETPVVGRESAYGAQGGKVGGPYLLPAAGGTQQAVDRGFVRTQPIGTSQFVGGSGNGGSAIMPPEVSIADVDDNFLPVGVTVSKVYKLAVPGARFASGLPELARGGVFNGYSWGHPNGAFSSDLVFYRHNSTGTATEVMRLMSDGNLLIKNGDGAPGGLPVAGGYLYADGGALKWKGSGGTVTTIAAA